MYSKLCIFCVSLSVIWDPVTTWLRERSPEKQANTDSLTAVTMATFISLRIRLAVQVLITFHDKIKLCQISRKSRLFLSVLVSHWILYFLAMIRRNRCFSSLFKKCGVIFNKTDSTIFSSLTYRIGHGNAVLKHLKEEEKTKMEKLASGKMWSPSHSVDFSGYSHIALSSFRLCSIQL